MPLAGVTRTDAKRFVTQKFSDREAKLRRLSQSNAEWARYVATVACTLQIALVFPVYRYCPAPDAWFLGSIESQLDVGSSPTFCKCC